MRTLGSWVLRGIWLGALVFSLGAWALSATASGGATRQAVGSCIDPMGGTCGQARADAGCEMDPDGCHRQAEGDNGGGIDPNGRGQADGSRIDPNGGQQAAVPPGEFPWQLSLTAATPGEFPWQLSLIIGTPGEFPWQLSSGRSANEEFPWQGAPRVAVGSSMDPLG